jgi:hypothetical protein
MFSLRKLFLARHLRIIDRANIYKGGIMRKNLLATISVVGVLMGASAANAAPVYIGYSINGDAVTQVATGSGSASVTNLNVNNGTDFFQFSASAEGTPPLPEPTLLSNSMTITGEHFGDISIYITETNQFPLGFHYFESLFGSSSIAPGATVVESTYFHDCGVPNASCNSTSDVFALSTLLSTATFTSDGTADLDAPLPAGSTSPYAITEVYSLTLTEAGYGYQNAGAIDERIPEPSALSLFVAALIGFAGFATYRRRKQTGADRAV